MPATLFAIAERHREHDNQVVQASDFTLVSDGTCEVQRVLDDPHCTLYCLDPAEQQALFVETPPHIDLYNAPFLYQAQFRNAQRIFGIPFADLIHAAAQGADPQAGLGFIYSVGRSGSTLLGRALQGIPEVQSLAEPDVLTQCIGMPPDNGPELLRACVHALCKPGARKRASYHVIKTRHLGIKLGASLQQLFPGSRSLFIYRSAVDMVISSLRAFHPQLLGFPEYRQDPVRFVTGQWISIMQHYLRLYRSGVLIRALRYEDLIGSRGPDRETAFRTLFDTICAWYGLAAPDSARLDAVFAADAQAGSNLSRESLGRRSIAEHGSSAEIERKVRDTLASHPELNRPDVVVPGTLSLEPLRT